MANEPKDQTTKPAASERRVLLGLAIATALALAADAVFGLSGILDHEQAHFRFETWWGFFGAFGIVASLALVAVAAALRPALRRPTHYYDP